MPTIRSQLYSAESYVTPSPRAPPPAPSPPPSHARVSLRRPVPPLLPLQMVLEFPDLPDSGIHLRAVPFGGPVHDRAVARVQRSSSTELVPKVDADGVVGPCPSGASTGHKQFFPALPVERVEGRGGCGEEEALFETPISKEMVIKFSKLGSLFIVSIYLTCLS